MVLGYPEEAPIPVEDVGVGVEEFEISLRVHFNLRLPLAPSHFD